MIIQCQACKTKYRFDESVMTGEGVWVRCSRCQNVFFQLSPSAMAEPRTQTAPQSPPREVLPEEREFLPEAIDDEILEQEVTRDERKNKNWVAWILGLVLVVLLVVAFFFFVPTAGQVILKQIGEIFPPARDFLSSSASVAAIGPAQVKITDMKQRFVEHAVMGKIRVVEGMAVNGSTVSMTRIKVRADLYDVLGVPVLQSVSFCGNLLTDQELATIPEEQILRKLSIPQGTDISNDRVPPGGMIPFMIVFLREPPGVAKTLVMPIEAERLLP